MDRSESNENKPTAPTPPRIELPKRSFSLEFYVGLFTLAGLLAVAWLAMGLGGLELLGSRKYEVVAKFSNVSGLQEGASVEIGGVPVGMVSDISLGDPDALVTLRLDGKVQIRDDDIISIRTKGIIGDRYVKISRGSSDVFVKPGATINYGTESVVDIEDLIGKLVHNFTSGKDSGEESGDKSSK